MKLLKKILVLLPTLALAVAALWFLSKPSGNGDSGDAATGESRLVVLIVFDQMRGDYLEKWAGGFGSDGFERIKRDGVWYSNCSLPYACSATGPGHASLSTGANPSVHGIIENEWYDRVKGAKVIASADEKMFARVPSGSDRGPGLAPTRILAPTLGEALKAGTGGKGRLFSFALKGRAAVLMGGKDATGVYCFDNGEFHTSRYYRDHVPAWVEQFNSSGVAGRWGGKTWDRLGVAADYDRLAGRDDQDGEYAQIITLPKQLPSIETGAVYYSALESSPFGNELLWDFAKAAISAEKLGTNGTRDLLCLSYSANDTIGHNHGPDSHETLDVTLRSDRLVGEMIAYLDSAVGPNRYTLIVTADHGIAPLPEVAVKTHPLAGRIVYSDLVNGLDEALDETFGKPDGNPGRWVEADFKLTRPWVYLNRRLIEAQGIPFESVESYAAKWLANRPDALTAFRRTALATGSCLPEEKPMFDAVRNAFHPERSGDVYVVQKPYLQLMGRASKGVDHGTVHDYDRNVFAMAYGAGVPKQGQRTAPMNWLSITPIVSKMLGIDPPAKSTKQLPEGWLDR